MKKEIVCVCFLISAFSCTSGERHSRLVLIQSFPQADSKATGEFLVHPYRMAAFRGHYVILDAVQACVKIYDSTGEFEKTIGSKGRGPGEMIDPFFFSVDRDTGDIACVDQGQNRIIVFSFDGKIKLNIRAMTPLMGITFLGRMIVTLAYNQSERTLFNGYDNNGKMINAFGEPVLPSVSDPRLRRTFNSVIIQGNADSLFVFYLSLPTFRIYSSEGTLLKTLEIKIAELQDLCGKNLEGANKGANAPLRINNWLDNAFVADGRVYCHTTQLLGGGILVFDFEGRLMRTITVPKISRDTESHLLFSAKMNDRYLFTDLGTAQVRVFREQTADGK